MSLSGTALCLVAIVVDAAIGCSREPPSIARAAAAAASTNDSLFTIFHSISPLDRAAFLAPIQGLSMAQYHAFLVARVSDPQARIGMASRTRALRDLAEEQAFYQAADAHFTSIGSFWQAGGYDNHDLTPDEFAHMRLNTRPNMGLAEAGYIYDQPRMHPDFSCPAARNTWAVAALAGVRDPYAVTAALNTARAVVHGQLQFNHDHNSDLIDVRVCNKCSVPQALAGAPQTPAYVQVVLDPERAFAEFWSLRRSADDMEILSDLRACVREMAPPAPVD